MKTEFTIFHNPRCTKSRETLKLLREKGVEPVVVEYLKNIPTKKKLEMILMKLHIKPVDLVRKTEALYKEKYKKLTMSDEEWIQVMLENPVLIERPIVIRGNKAIIGRPPEQVLTLIS
ncbi:MAG: arsenate reductase (glutaredoxin) [Bacteroidetes bacterium]|nr:arsenate reductase (glutaredoxin) [Bacteroidota bacterium]